MRDREVASLAVSPDVAEAYRRRAHNMAEAAWNVYRSNKVILCQTRLAEGRYFYHAVKK
jgi:hypothetical protein